MVVEDSSRLVRVDDSDVDVEIGDEGLSCRRAVEVLYVCGQIPR